MVSQLCKIYRNHSVYGFILMDAVSSQSWLQIGIIYTIVVVPFSLERDDEINYTHNLKIVPVSTDWKI
jgi:hypothetical protein